MIISDRGISIVAALFTLIILGIFGATIVVLVAAEQESRRGQLSQEWAFYDVQAGLEYALREIDQGGYPLVTNKVFGKGSFTIDIDYDEVSTRDITAAASVGSVQKVYQISYDSFGGDCLFVDFSSAQLTGTPKTDLSGLTLRKICNEGVNIDRIFMSWDPEDDEEVISASIGGSIVWEDVDGLPSGSSVDITDTLLTGSAAYPVDVIRFNSDMSGSDLTLRFIMTDSSTETVSFPLP